MNLFFYKWFISSFGYLEVVFPWLLVGIIISWGLKRFLNETIIRRFLGNSSILSIITAEIIGAFSPVSVIALLPLSATLLAEGASPITLTAFLLAARAYNPEALPVSLSLLGLKITLLNLGVTFVAVTACSLAIKKLGLSINTKKLRNESFYAELLRFVLYIFVGVLVAGLIVTIVPTGFVAHYWSKSFLSLPVVIIFGFLTYLGFVGYLPIAKSFLDLGLSGAAVVTFISSASIINLTFLLMFMPIIGRRRTLQIFLIYLFVVVVFGTLFFALHI